MMCFSTGECPMAIIIKLDVESVGLHPEELMWKMSIIVNFISCFRCWNSLGFEKINYCMLATNC
jgi:hypothetical protein